MEEQQNEEQKAIAPPEKLEGIVILSGGMDSAALLGRVVGMLEAPRVGAITFNYGQRHSKEIEASTKVAKHYGVRHEIVDISGISRLLKGSSQTDPDVEVPEGHYEADNMKATVVPNRNMIMISVAAAWAISEGCRFLFYGAHAGDHAVYPDCRPEFRAYCEGAILKGNYDAPTLEAPFIMTDKMHIAKEGLANGVPFELTWTCYKGGEKACGKCGTCVERIESFAFNRTEDPIPYAKKLDWPALFERYGEPLREG